MKGYKKRVTGRQLKKKLESIYELIMMFVLIALIVKTAEPGYAVILIGYAVVKLAILFNWW